MKQKIRIAIFSLLMSFTFFLPTDIYGAGISATPTTATQPQLNENRIQAIESHQLRINSSIDRSYSNITSTKTIIDVLRGRIQAFTDRLSTTNTNGINVLERRIQSFLSSIDNLLQRVIRQRERIILRAEVYDFNEQTLSNQSQNYELNAGITDKIQPSISSINDLLIAENRLPLSDNEVTLINSFFLALNGIETSWSENSGLTISQDVSDNIKFLAVMNNRFYTQNKFVPLISTNLGNLTTFDTYLHMGTAGESYNPGEFTSGLTNTDDGISFPVEGLELDFSHNGPGATFIFGGQHHDNIMTTSYMKDLVIPRSLAHGWHLKVTPI